MLNKPLRGSNEKTITYDSFTLYCIEYLYLPTDATSKKKLKFFYEQRPTQVTIPALNSKKACLFECLAEFKKWQPNDAGI